MAFPIVMYGCESWNIKKAMKNRLFWTVVLENTFESPLNCKIKPVKPKGNQSWIFIRKTDAEAETPTLWTPDAKSWLFRKDPDAGKECRQEKRTTGNQTVGWHHWPNGHEFEPTLGYGEVQGSLACCSSWGHKGSDTTEQLSSKLKTHLTCKCSKTLGRPEILSHIE